MKKGILIGLLALGLGAPAIHGASILEAVDEIVTLADVGPQAADTIKRNLATLKTAVKAKQIINALTALEQILTHATKVVGPTSNLLAALGDISLIKRKVPKITAGTSKIKDLAKSLRETSDQVTELVEVAQILQ